MNQITKLSKTQTQEQPFEHQVFQINTHTKSVIQKANTRVEIGSP
jgi:hypothetical protein